MKKIKFDIVEKKLLRTVVIFVLVQILIIAGFIRVFSISHPVDINDTKQIDIIVEDTYYVNLRRGGELYVIADSREYLIGDRTTFDEYSVIKLYKTICKGDRLSLKYYEGYNIFGKVNRVVDARTETKIYRSFDEYTRGKQMLPATVVIIFSIIESVFLGVVFVYVWIGKNIFKDIYRKTKRYLMNK